MKAEGQEERGHLMNTGISFQIGPEQEKTGAGGGVKDRPGQLGLKIEGHPTCAGLGERGPGFPEPHRTSAYTNPALWKFPSLLHWGADRAGWEPGVPHLEARGSTVRGF